MSRNWTIKDLDDHPLPEGWTWGKRSGRWYAYADDDGPGWEGGDIVEVVDGQVYRVDAMGEVWPALADVAFAVLQVSRGHDSPEAMVKALEAEMGRGLDFVRAMLRRRTVQP